MADASPSTWKLYHNPHFSSETCYNSPAHLLPGDLNSVPSGADGTYGGGGSNDLNLVHPEIVELRAALELERGLRRSAESLARAMERDLAEERLARADAEAEAAQFREAAGRAEREAEKELQMLRISEAFREERVHMKLAEAAIVLEEKIRQVASNVDGAGPARAHQMRERQCWREAENPQIKRGMKGISEFTKAIRVRAP
ncbi:hypothetical protein AXF42_Ash001509 [Apostasia shenzhenica]|uniref:Uncharacterized protein n=1 Tax=Apostasia shenzhenica TaxID=1088818 RepID=A0A2I0AAF2_9ASPA|nr:hypothetical protein AXF42_Ash001509 [Apostasia shenzhenica]